MSLPKWGTGIGVHLIKIRDGEPVSGVFRGEPVFFYQHWVKNRGEICRKPNHCPHCEAGERGIKRFRINFLVLNHENQWEAKILESGKRVYEQLEALDKDIRIDKAKCKIMRSGVGIQSTTQITIYPGDNGIVQEDLEKVLLQVELHDLKATISTEDQASSDEMDDLPDFTE